MLANKAWSNRLVDVRSRRAHLKWFKLVLLTIVIPLLLTGCLGVIGQWLVEPDRLTGHWEGTITSTSASTQTCIDLVLPLGLMLIELDDGSVISTGFRMAYDPTDFEKGAVIHGTRTGS